MGGETHAPYLVVSKVGPAVPADRNTCAGIRAWGRAAEKP